METKQCRNCKLEIHKDARLCQHCHGYQSWLADQRDPRLAAALFVFLLVIFAALFLVLGRLSPSVDHHETPSLKIMEHSERFASAPDGTHIFVLGQVKNESEIDASAIWLRVDLFDSSGRLLDSLRVQAGGLVVPRRSAELFRVTGLIAVPQSEVKRTDTVARSMKASRWD